MREKNKEQHKKHHTKSHDDNEDNVGEDDSSVTYDTVAIPEIHIRKKKDK